MITPYKPCDVCGYGLETVLEENGKVYSVISKCENCGQIFRDKYEIKHIGRDTLDKEQFKKAKQHQDLKDCVDDIFNLE